MRGTVQRAATTDEMGYVWRDIPDTCGQPAINEILILGGRGVGIWARGLVLRCVRWHRRLGITCERGGGRVPSHVLGECVGARPM